MTAHAPRHQSLPVMALPCPTTGRLTAGVALILAVLGWLVLRGVQPMNDVVWQFWIARQMLGGARLYTDIWEVNPPLWFWSAMPVEALAESTGIGWQTLLSAAVAGFGALSAWLVVRLAAPSRPGPAVTLLVLVFAMTVLLPLPGLGQREPWTLILSLPYTALITRRRMRLPVSTTMAITVGALGACGFALKHYFVLVPLVLEGWLALGLKRGWRLWRAEVLTLAALALAYAVAVLVLAPDFLKVIVPMVRIAYNVSLPPMILTFVKPAGVAWVLTGSFLWLMRHEPRRKLGPVVDALYPALLLVTGGFLIGYLLQRRGWDYHSMAASGSLAIALGLQAMRMKRRGPTLAALLLLGGLMVFLYPLRPAGGAYDHTMDRVAAGEAVFVAAHDAGAIWPAPEMRHLRWTSRAYSLWMVPAVLAGEKHGPDAAALRDLGASVVRESSHDIRCTPPALIMMERIPGDRAGTSSFDAFLKRDADLRAFLATYYIALPATPRAMAYERRGPIAPDPRLSCRTIR